MKWNPELEGLSSPLEDRGREGRSAEVAGKGV